MTAKEPKTSQTPASADKPKMMSRPAVRAFMHRLSEVFPNPRTELVYRNHFELLVCVVLSAQATDKSVNQAAPALFAVAPTPEAMAALGEEGIAPYIRKIGLWRAKARNLALLARQLIERHNGEVPDTRPELEALAGVGHKTAGVILNVAFGQPTLAVDTHIFRVSNRTGLAPGKNVLTVEEELLARIPPDQIMPAHHEILLLGRYICKARTPECWQCPTAKWCLFSEKNLSPSEKLRESSGQQLAKDLAHVRRVADESVAIETVTEVTEKVRVTVEADPPAANQENQEDCQES
ncbi:endonuclease III [Oecophyllibacter saccharovorans]